MQHEADKSRPSRRAKTRAKIALSHQNLDKVVFVRKGNKDVERKKERKRDKIDWVYITYTPDLVEANLYEGLDLLFNDIPNRDPFAEDSESETEDEDSELGGEHDIEDENPDDDEDEDEAQVDEDDEQDHDGDDEDQEDPENSSENSDLDDPENNNQSDIQE